MDPNQPPPTTTDGLTSLLQGIQSSLTQKKAPNPYLSTLGSAFKGPSPASLTSPAPNYDPASIQGYAKQQSDAIFGPGHFDALHQLVNNESGWNPMASNPTSTARGLFQFLDTTAPSYGLPADATQATPQQQVDAGIKYIQSRYGDPTKALDFWNNVAPTMSAGNGSHWY